MTTTESTVLSYRHIEQQRSDLIAALHRIERLGGSNPQTVLDMCREIARSAIAAAEKDTQPVQLRFEGTF